MYRLLPLLAVVSALASCTTTQSIPVDERSRTYDAPVPVVLEAAIQALVVQGYPIAFVDRASGLITTDVHYKERVLGDRRLRANVYVDHVAGGQARLTLLLSAITVSDKGSVDADTMLRRTARGLYEELLNEIEARV